MSISLRLQSTLSTNYDRRSLNDNRRLTSVPTATVVSAALQMKRPLTAIRPARPAGLICPFPRFRGLILRTCCVVIRAKPGHLPAWCVAIISVRTETYRAINKDALAEVGQVIVFRARLSSQLLTGDGQTISRAYYLRPGFHTWSYLCDVRIIGGWLPLTTLRCLKSIYEPRFYKSLLYRN